MTGVRVDRVMTTRAGGITVGFRRTGAGRRLVLLHGALGHSGEWRHQLEGLADAFDVIAWDAPGCGASDDIPPGADLDTYADHLAALLDALDVEAADLGGLSWGGGLALAMATRHPARVRRLILVSAYAGWAGSLPGDEVARRLARALSDASRPPAAVAREWMGELLSAGAAPELGEELAALVAGFRPEGVRTMARAFAAADLRERCARVAAPTLIIAGGKDVRSPPRVARALRDRIPGARMLAVPDAGHMVPVEAPRVVNDAIRGFAGAGRT